MSLVTRISLITLFSLIAFATRLLPHEPNMTAMGALALASGFLLPRRWGMVLPLLVILVSDFWLGGYEIPVMISVYGSMAVVAFVGGSLRTTGVATRIGGGAIVSSTFFFLATNFAVWAATPWYPKTLTGLMTSYTLALPFFRNMLAGDIVFMALFVGSIALCEYWANQRSYLTYNLTYSRIEK